MEFKAWLEHRIREQQAVILENDDIAVAVANSGRLGFAIDRFKFDLNQIAYEPNSISVPFRFEVAGSDERVIKGNAVAVIGPGGGVTIGMRSAGESMSRKT